MLVLNFTPFPELKTQRLLLRKLEKTDANEMFFLRSNENVLRYLEKNQRRQLQKWKNLSARSIKLLMKMNLFSGGLLS
jgi:ribosomal-protein-alanine N-acetyltransferase